VDEQHWSQNQSLPYATRNDIAYIVPEWITQVQRLTNQVLLKNKPVDELARVLLSFKRLLLSVDVASNDTLLNPANFTLPMQASLFYAARCKAGAGNCSRHEKF